MKLPITPTWTSPNREKLAFAYAVRNFTRYRAHARDARARGSICSAREWAAEARKEWTTIERHLTA